MEDSNEEATASATAPEEEFGMFQSLTDQTGLSSVGLLLIVLAMFSFCAFLLYRLQKLKMGAAAASGGNSSNKKKARSSLDSNSVSMEDVAYLARVLGPESTCIDILLAALTTPEMLDCAEHEVETVKAARQQRRKEKQREEKKDESAFEVDDDGWGDDDDGDETDPALAKLQQAEQERAQELERLKVATGQKTELMEGVDDGVLGQAWVMQTLESNGQWPPKILASSDIVKKQTLTYNGKICSTPLDHKGLERYLCMTMGRLNAQMLNTHPELLRAGASKRIDQTYFKSAVDFRSRVGMVLEAILRLGICLKCTSLVATTVETVALFKLGCPENDEKTTTGFRLQMQAQFGCHPELAVLEKEIQHDKYQEIAAGESAEVLLNLERAHAENFVKIKVGQAQKQGLPPQVALQSYREGWWFLLRLQRNGKATNLDGLVDIKEDAPILSKCQPGDLTKYKNVSPQDRLLQAWPMMVQNCAQKSGKIKVQFKAPSTPGDYTFILDIKSQDFLGSDQRLEIPVTIVPSDFQPRTPRPEPAEAKKEN